MVSGMDLKRAFNSKVCSRSSCNMGGREEGMSTHQGYVAGHNTGWLLAARSMLLLPCHPIFLAVHSSSPPFLMRRTWLKPSSCSNMSSSYRLGHSEPDDKHWAKAGDARQRGRMGELEQKRKLCKCHRSRACHHGC